MVDAVERVKRRDGWEARQYGPYTYDGSGQRMTKRGPQGETGYINQWITLRNGEVGTKHVFAGTTRVVSKLVKQDKPNAKRKGRIVYEKDQYYYHPDHLGTTAYITHTNGQVYQHLEYFPFGETWVEEHSNKQRTPYQFTAKEMDEETGLYYFGARYYDPRTSVWQSVDPILDRYLPKRESSSEQKDWVFQSTNYAMYTYGRNRPLTQVDPDGRASLSVSVSASLGVTYGERGLEFGPSTGGSIGLALSVPTPWDDAELDVGVTFTRTGGAAMSKETGGSSRKMNLSVGRAVVGVTGSKGSVLDLEGEGETITGTLAVAGGHLNRNLDGDVVGIGLQGGAGLGMSSEGTVTEVYSARRGAISLGEALISAAKDAIQDSVDTVRDEWLGTFPRAAE